MDPGMGGMGGMGMSLRRIGQGERWMRQSRRPSPHPRPLRAQAGRAGRRDPRWCGARRELWTQLRLTRWSAVPACHAPAARAMAAVTIRIEGARGVPRRHAAGREEGRPPLCARM